jgi:hypothetical protein
MKAKPLLNDYAGIDRRRAFLASQSSICFRERNDAFDIAVRIENALDSLKTFENDGKRFWKRLVAFRSRGKQLVLSRSALE